MLDRFTPAARRAVVQAGIQATGDGQDVLGPEFLLLALADGGPLAGRAQGLGPSPAAVRDEIVRLRGRRASHRNEELLSVFGIDPAEVRRRAFSATGIRADDPALWALSRSRLRPLRVTLDGPACHALLNEGSRKVIEVATWACRRGRRPKAGREDLLWGLLADQGSPAVRILRRLDTDILALWRDLQNWHASARPL
jgi:hypothetical protein